MFIQISCPKCSHFRGHYQHRHEVPPCPVCGYPELKKHEEYYEAVVGTPNMKHELKKEYTGSGITECITPTCSCGWRGIGYEAHNDWQYTLVKEQEDEHRKTTTR